MSWNSYPKQVQNSLLKRLGSEFNAGYMQRQQLWTFQVIIKEPFPNWLIISVLPSFC